MAMMMCSRMWQKKETERDRERGKGTAEEKATEDAFVVVMKLLTHTGNVGKGGGVAAQGQCIIFAHVATVSLRVCVCVCIRCINKYLSTM